MGSKRLEMVGALERTHTSLVQVAHKNSTSQRHEMTVRSSAISWSRVLGKDLSLQANGAILFLIQVAGGMRLAQSQTPPNKILTNSNNSWPRTWQR